MLGAAPAGVALALLSAAPASAQLFFDIFNPPQQPQYSAPERQRVYEHRRSHRRHQSEERHRRHRHREAKRERAWNPKEVKGPFQIVVAIASQELLLYGQDGLIGRASISTGMPDHPTPTGVFTVLSKARWHQSNIYSGAPMPWMQRITWSGVAMHEGPRPGYPASHGCIRLPGDFAVRLYHTTKVGARVIVTRQPVVPEPIVSAKLFEPAPPEVKAQAKPVTVAANGDAATHMAFAAKTSSAKTSAPRLRAPRLRAPRAMPPATIDRRPTRPRRAMPRRRPRPATSRCRNRPSPPKSRSPTTSRNRAGRYRCSSAASSARCSCARASSSCSTCR